MTPDLQLRTLCVLDAHSRITSSAEPTAHRGQFFMLIRGFSNCAWAVRDDVPGEIAEELDRLAREEPPLRDPQDAPLHADEYLSLVGGQVVSGPAFCFPDRIAESSGLALVDSLEPLERNFRGWKAEEISLCSPIVAVMDDGYPVSVCFCATRNSAPAVEAGVETAAAFRGRGFALRVTAAWARAIRESGRIPLYSTDWSNTASRAVARKLGLVQYAANWSLVANSGTKAG